MDKQNGNKNGSNPEDSNKLNSSNDTNYFYRRGRYDDDDDDSVDISYKVNVSFIRFIYLFIYLTLIFRTTSLAPFIYY